MAELEIDDPERSCACRFGTSAYNRRSCAVETTVGERCWVWVFGDVEGLRWVLERNLMAFRDAAKLRVQKHRPGDWVAFYTSRSAYGKPSDPARIAGVARVAREPEHGDAVSIGGREFDWFVRFAPEKVLPERAGPDVRKLVDELEFVKKPALWGQYFRNSPLEVSRKDFQVLDRAVRSWKRG